MKNCIICGRPCGRLSREGGYRAGSTRPRSRTLRAKGDKEQRVRNGEPNERMTGIKDEHPRVGPDTDVKNPDEPIHYAELAMGVTTLQYRTESSSFGEEGFVIVTHIIDGRDRLYKRTEPIEEDLAHKILDAKNNGYWGYVE